MAFKERSKSYPLRIMISLKNRTTLSKEDHYYYLNQDQGFEGEYGFDDLTEKLTCECLILNDLLLQYRYTTFQIDALIITAHGIHTYEIKNFSGEYIYKEELFQSVYSGEDFQSPLAQLNKSTILLGKLLGTFQTKLPLTSFLAFVHPEFVLYQAPFFKSILLPNKLAKHFRKLNSQSGKLTEEHYAIAQKLCELSANTVPIYNNLPTYTYDELRKGASCPACGCLFKKAPFRNKTCVCADCNHKSLISDVIRHNICEFKLLFPERKVTTLAVYQWCDGEFSMKRIRLVLQRENCSSESKKTI